MKNCLGNHSMADKEQFIVKIREVLVKIPSHAAVIWFYAVNRMNNDVMKDPSDGARTKIMRFSGKKHQHGRNSQQFAGQN